MFVRWMGAFGKDGFDSRKIMQLCLLLKVDTNHIQEIPTNKDNVFALPQLVGATGAVIEVKPAISCKPTDEGRQYSENKVVQFFDFNTGKTLNEAIKKLEPKKVGEIVEKLKERTYKEWKTKEQNQAPKQFEASTELTSEDLPF